MMKRIAFVAAVVGAIIATVTPAMAKGPTSATIEGPGIEEPIVLDAGLLGGGGGNALMELADQTGFWFLAFGTNDLAAEARLLVEAPTGDLGPNYVLTWYMGDVSIPFDVYPHAEGGPLVKVAPHLSPVYVGEKSLDVWYQAAPRLTVLLERYGVPVSKLQPTEQPNPVVSPIEQSSSGPSPALVVAGAAAVVIVALGIAPARRRRAVSG